MKVYLDLLLILNFFLDFILLLGVSILLKRKVKLKRIAFGAFTGMISFLVLVISFNSMQLLIFKFLTGLLMVIVTFGIKDMKYLLNNIYYLYTLSIVLGGALYLIKNNNFINYLYVLILIPPIIIYFYIKQQRTLKNKYSNYYNVTIYLNNIPITLTGYLDTGNSLEDPYFKRPIIIVSRNYLENYRIEKKFLVPYTTVSSNSLMECFKPDKIVINGNSYNKVLVGISEEPFCIDGVSCLLNRKLLEE